MDLGTSRYDAELQMFADEPHELDLARLHFLRWSAERGQLEHEIAGPSAGDYAALAPTEPGIAD
jgi:hypothetical protein